MNCYQRLSDLLSADQILVESIEEQQRIDELLGRIGRAVGSVFGGKPASPYMGQWNPLRGKHEGGLGQKERMGAIQAKVDAKKAAAKAAGKPSPYQLPKLKSGKPKPKPRIRAKPRVTSNAGVSDAIPGEPENASTYYGKITSMIRESLQINEKKGPCWKGYEAVGMKKKGGRKVPNCVPKKK